MVVMEGRLPLGCCHVPDRPIHLYLSRMQVHQLVHLKVVAKLLRLLIAAKKLWLKPDLFTSAAMHHGQLMVHESEQYMCFARL